jgi:hypothetical protein
LDFSVANNAYDGNSFRSRLTTAAEQPEFPILTELRSAGVTDYVVLSVPFSDGTNKALSLATTRAGGFSDNEIALFEAMTPAVAVNLEIQALQGMSRTLLDTYVGRQAGGRVLARPNPARHGRDHQRRDLALRLARVHQPLRKFAAR